jgi:hypothetical protein
VTTEALPDSTLPDELRKLGYDVRENGESERILAAGIAPFSVMQNPLPRPQVSGSGTAPDVTLWLRANLANSASPFDEESPGYPNSDKVALLFIEIIVVGKSDTMVRGHCLTG